jgi:hypothetical protein
MEQAKRAVTAGFCSVYRLFLLSETGRKEEDVNAGGVGEKVCYFGR